MSAVRRRDAPPGREARTKGGGGKIGKLGRADSLPFVKGAALMLALGLGAASCRKPAPPAPRELRVAVPLAATFFDPHASIELAAFIVNANIYDTLVATDTDLRPIPALAASWSTPDDTTWIFDLVRGVRFQDGSSLDSAD